MCSYVTEKAEVTGSGKGPDGWFALTHANVYFDHPFHAALEHSLNIDFVDGKGSRVAVELSAESARALVTAVDSALSRAEG